MRSPLRVALATCAVALGLASVGGGQLAAQTVTARVGGELTGLPYTTVIIPVVVDMTASGGARLGSYTARLSWDPLALTFCSSCSPDSLRGNFPAPQINTDSAAAGVLRFTAISALGVDSLVTVARLPFSTGADTLSTAFQLGFSEMSAAATFTSLLPILTVGGASYCPARGRWGDLDRDGYANSRDALMILSNVVGIPLDTTKITTSLGDVDADGRVTSRDALIVLSYAVGIGVPGERVLLLAPSSCGTGSATRLSVFPASATLAVSQALHLTAQASDSAGRAVTVTGATWASSDYGVAGVDTSGLVTARAPGTATVTAAVGPGVQAAATITVIARRTTWYVDLRATGAAVELGDAAYPFEQPGQAYALAAEGDTIRVAQGTYLFTADGVLSHGVVILGGTPGDTTTRPTFVDPSGYLTALWLQGGSRTLVRNVAFRGFGYAVDLDGAKSLALEDVDVRVQGSAYGNGVSVWNSGVTDSVRVERSVFEGDSAAPSGYGIDYSGNGAITLTTVRDSKFRFLYEGLYLYEADTVDVTGSVISDNSSYGILLSQENVARPALHVAHSRLERNGSYAINGYSLGRLVVDSSVIRATQNDAIDVYVSYALTPLAELYLRGDSIYMEEYAADYYWLYAYGADTVVMDQSVVRFPADTSSFWTYGTVDADNASITRTQFLNVSDASDLLDFTGRVFFADSVTTTGCRVAGCDVAYGFYINTSGTGASATFQQSLFSQIAFPVYLSASNGPAIARSLVIDSAYDAVQLYGDDSVAAAGNLLTRISDQGLTVNGYSTPRGPVVVQRNTIRSGPKGIVVNLTDTVTTQVDSNGVSGTTSAAVYVQGGRVEMTGNNIQNNASYGFYSPNPTGFVHQAHGNAFIGNALYAVATGSDSVDATANWWGTTDSATVAISVSGRIATYPFLTSLPGGLPALAPRALVASARVAGAPLSARMASGTPRPPARADRAPHAAPQGMVPPAGASAAKVARLQQVAAVRAARDAREAARRAEIEARRASQRQQAEARHAALRGAH